MSSAYSYAIRVLSCPSCAAPIEVPPAGGATACPYCASSVEITPRDEHAAQILSSLAGETIPETERLRRLRAQDGADEEPPAELAPLFKNGAIAPWKQAEAEAMWKLLIGQLRRSAEIHVAEQLLLLTLKLAEPLDVHRAGQKRRALLESALEADPLPRHRQVLLCWLSRDALALDDLEAAAQWLNRCDPRADDLKADSHFRVAQALASTRMQRHEGVLEALGADPGAVPILDELDELALLLRCNAHEKLGRKERAVELLCEHFLAAGIAARRRVQALREVHAALELCPASYEAAVAAYGVRLKTRGASMGKFFMGLGAAFPILALALPFVLGFGGEAERSFTIRFGLMFGGFMMLVFSGLGLFMWLGEQAHDRILASGTWGDAEVIKVASTSENQDGSSVSQLSVQVSLPGTEPYAADTSLTTPKGRRLPAVGDVLPVLVSPQDHSKVLAEM